MSENNASADLGWRLGGTAGYTMGAVARWTVIDDTDGKSAAYVRSAKHARLVAAAPDLYEVADEAPILSKYHGNQGFDLERFVVDYDAWSQKRRAALAKARGEV